MRRLEIGRLCCGLALGCLWPTVASAQSTIAGLVTDATGGVLPGVTVEAASPALIEKVRSVSTDGEGRYAIIDLRPGVYTVSFTLQGFNSVRREAIEVVSNVSVPINAEMRVGAVEETITVTAETPVVDVQSVARRSTIDREQLETLPITRNPAQMLALAPGVKVSLAQGRAGVNGATENVFVGGRGLTMFDTRWNLDGMDVRSGNLSGLANLRLNDAMVEETVFETFGASIESATGGVSLNQIPRDGGNRFSGQAFLGGNLESWVGDNLSQELKDQGIKAATTVGPNRDFSIAFGGPVKRDRLWFYGSWRSQRTQQYQADLYDQQAGIRDESNWWFQNPLPTWKQFYEYTPNQNYSLRLTSHLAQGQKLTAHYDRMFTSLKKSDPYAYWWDQFHSLDYMGQVKYTNTMSSRLLVDSGLSMTSYEHHGVDPVTMSHPRYSPGWYATAVRRDLETGRELYGHQLAKDARNAKRHAFSTNLTYVTGSHAFKTGVQIGDASDSDGSEWNGDITQLYRNGVPDSVLAHNSPTRNDSNMDLELGLYAGDTWTLKKLTLTGGVRFDRWEGSIHEYVLPAGRFVKERHQPEYVAPAQSDVSGRIGATYDVFGNARTAVKASFGKYLANVGTQNLRASNPQLEVTQSLVWFADTNGDRLAQDNEIESIQAINPGFYNGQPRTSLDPNWEREYMYQASLGVQHQLVAGLGVSAMYFRTNRRNIQWTDRTAISVSDYVPVDVVTPDGEVITVHNLPTDALRTAYASSPTLFRTDGDADSRRIDYEGVELSVNGRLPGGGRATVGWSFEKNTTISCGDQIDNPNLARFCDAPQPFRHEFKVQFTQQLPFGIDASATMNSMAGLPLPETWTISRTLRYATNCTGPCRPGDFVINNPRLGLPNIALALVAPGAKFYDRYTDLGIGLGRVFRMGNRTLRAGVSIFNAINHMAFITQGTNRAAPTSFGRPTITQEPRVFQASLRYSF